MTTERVATNDARGKTWPRALLLAGFVLLIAALAPLAPSLADGMELVRLRNAWQLSAADAKSFDWPATAPPPGFMVETAAPDPYYVALAERLRLAALPDDWQRALAIGRHLPSAPTLDGPPIQSDLRTTHERIVGRGDGYCGDYTRVFTGLALAVGMPVRTWSFSLDRFGGHGHIWPEIWNRQLGRWQMLDVYNNDFMHLGDGRPLAALELRTALERGDPGLRREPIASKARQGYPIEAKYWAYWREGLPGWYLQWGNAVFSADAVARDWPGVRALRAVEQAVVIATGNYPKIKPLADAHNAADIAALWRLHQRLHWQLLGIAVALLALLIGGVGLLRAKPAKKNKR